MSDDGLVFVVDDEESVRRALSRLFRSVDLEVEAFASPQAFLAHPGQDRPSCLVLDVRMPGASGLAFQQELARTNRELPIVFISGHGDVPTSVRAMKAGAVDFLQKPFSDQELLDAVQRALERDRAARAARAARDAVQRRVEALTPRERQVLALVVAGMLNKQIGARLGASEKTVKVHRGRVMAKMGATSVAELVRMAHAVGLSPDG